jgi:WD40 repeat protein
MEEPMGAWRCCRGALGIGVSAAFLGACSAQGNLPQASPFLAKTVAATSTKSAVHGALLYIASETGEVYAYTYPGGKLVNSFKTAERAGDLCSDADGNVWVVESAGSSEPGNIVEYAHGGTTPIGTLSDDEDPQDCAVDPTTGNLAVADDYYATIAIFEKAQGQPTYYSSVGSVGIPQLVTYDSAGDLFLSARRMNNYGWLPHNGSHIEPFKIKSGKSRQGLQWDGQYLTVMTFTMLNRYQVVGSAGQKVGAIKGFSACDGRYWISEGTGLACTNYSDGTAAIYKYPSGSLLTGISGLASPYGITVSVAPKR